MRQKVKTSLSFPTHSMHSMQHASNFSYFWSPSFSGEKFRFGRHLLCRLFRQAFSSGRFFTHESHDYNAPPTPTTSAIGV